MASFRSGRAAFSRRSGGCDGREGAATGRTWSCWRSAFPVWERIPSVPLASDRRSPESCSPARDRAHHRRLSGSDPLPDEYSTIPCLGLAYSTQVHPGCGSSDRSGTGVGAATPEAIRLRAARRRADRPRPVELGFRLGRERPALFDWPVTFSALGVWIREILRPSTAPPARQEPTSGLRRRGTGCNGARVSSALACPHDRGEAGLEITEESTDEEGWSAGVSSVSWRLLLWREL